MVVARDEMACPGIRGAYIMPLSLDGHSIKKPRHGGASGVLQEALCDLGGTLTRAAISQPEEEAEQETQE